MTVSQAYLDHPPWRRIFDEREPGQSLQPDSDMMLRASALAETLLDAMERSLHFGERGLPEAGAGLHAWIEDSFRFRSFLRDWLESHKRWYSSRLLEILDQVRRELDAISQTASETDPG